MSDCIIETADGVTLIRFYRPERLNAMGGTMLDEMNAAIAAGRLDDRVRAFVVTGQGRAWCAGADLAPDNGRVTEGGPRFQANDDLGFAGRTVLNVYACDKPVIAAINGVTVGGGFGLAASMDIRIASEHARFSTVFIKRALAPDFGLSWFLPRMVGAERAAEMFYTGRMVGAEEALSLGIVSKVVPQERLLDEALGLARQLAKQPPTALTMTRRALQHAQTNPLDRHLAFEWANQKACIASPEFQEGVASFLEKREADFSTF